MGAADTPTRSPRRSILSSPSFAPGLGAEQASAYRAGRCLLAPGLLRPRPIEQLEQLVRGELDLLVLPLARTVLARDQARSMHATEIAEDEGIATLGLVRCSVRQAEVPGRVVGPSVRLEERVLPVGGGLRVAPVAPDDVLPPRMSCSAFRRPASLTE